MFTHVHPFTPIRSNRYLLDSDVDPNFHPILVFQLPGHRLGSGPAIFPGDMAGILPSDLRGLYVVLPFFTTKQWRSYLVG